MLRNDKGNQIKFNEVFNDWNNHMHSHNNSFEMALRICVNLIKWRLSFGVGQRYTNEYDYESFIVVKTTIMLLLMIAVSPHSPPRIIIMSQFPHWRNQKENIWKWKLLTLSC